jgi:hypothetical protein
MAGTRRAALWPAALLGLAFMLRLGAIGGSPAGDEAVHYFSARTFGQTPPNVHGVWDSRFLFWQRPVFSLMLAPFAQWGFDVYRVAHAVLAATLSPLTMRVLQAHRIRTSIAAGAGAIVAVHPIFVTWGSRVFPDTLMTVLCGLGLLLWVREQHVWGAVALLLAAWTKEVAVVGILAMLTFSLLDGWRAGRLTRRTTQVTSGEIALTLALFLAPLPLIYSTRVRGWLFPGWGRGGYSLELVDLLFLSAWFIPLLVWGWVRRPKDSLSIWPFVFPAFYLAYRLLLNGAVGGWYVVLPVWFVILGLAALVHDVLPAPGRSAPLRIGAVSLAVAVVLLVVAADVAIAENARSKLPFHPLEGERERYRSTVELLDPGTQDHALDDVVGFVRARQPASLFLVDVGWYYIYYPFASLAPDLTFGITDGPQGALLTTLEGQRYIWELPTWTEYADRWRANAETPGTLTVVAKTGDPLNVALREWYAACTLQDTPDYVVFEGSKCP